MVYLLILSKIAAFHNAYPMPQAEAWGTGKNTSPTLRFFATLQNDKASLFSYFAVLTIMSMNDPLRKTAIPTINWAK